jgi:uncharacterized protein YndB with AHSA1/START domain
MPVDPKTTAALILKRAIPAPREKVFDAWTTPELIAQWFCPGENYSVAIAEFDLTVGGAFRLGIRDPKGDIRIATGIYIEIQKPEKLVFTWSWDHDPMNTRITLTFHKVGDSTELVLKHELLPTPEKRDDHEKGWSGCLQHLEMFFLHSK